MMMQIETKALRSYLLPFLSRVTQTNGICDLEAYHIGIGSWIILKQI